MFERYTEQARRVIFFARYEASQFGSELMEPEHFLLALFREAPSLMSRVLPGVTGEMVRTQIEHETAPRPKVSTSIDMPLSHALKRVLAFGAEEAERMNHKHIGTEHHLLGLLREPSVASRILESLGVTLEGARQLIAKSGVAAEPQPLSPEEAAAERESLRALIAALPDDALRQARNMLDHLRMFPKKPPPIRPPIAELRQRMLERTGQTGFFGAGSAWMQEGYFSSSSMENGTMTFETRRFHQGHKITLIEKLRVSDDGKTLNYSQQLRGPKGEHQWSMDFDIT